MPGAVNSNMSRPMPPHRQFGEDWVQNGPLVAAAHRGAATSWTYMTPVIKYAEAYNAMTGPGWGAYVSYLNYNHGNQPYDRVDSGLNTAHRTPTQPNWFALAKISPKSSMQGVQLAQQSVANMLQYRATIQPLGG